MNFLFETRGNDIVKNCELEHYRRRWNGKIRSYILQLTKNGHLFLPATRTARFNLDSTISIELKQLSEFDHILICFDFLDNRNHQRVLQLSTAVRGITRSPYMIKDVIKLGEPGQWCLLTIRLPNLVGLFSQPLNFLTRIRVYGKLEMRNIFIGSGSSLICNVEVSYPKQDQAYVDAEKIPKRATPLSNLIDSMEICKLSYSQALEKIDGLKHESFNIYSGKANHVLYKPKIGTTDTTALPKIEARTSKYHLYPIAAEWRKSSINSSIDVLTEIDNRDDII